MYKQLKPWQQCKTLRLYMTNLTKSEPVLLEIMYRNGMLNCIMYSSC